MDTKIPQMESQVLELNQIIERLTRDTEKEQRKRLEVVKERDEVK